jgi:hypothetical protein
MERLAHLIKHKEPMPEEPLSLTQEQARDIMGRNFLGTKEVEEHFGKLTPEQQEALSTIPFSKETLESCKDTHILVADIGPSIMDLKKLKKCIGLFRDQDWYETENFAKHTDQPSWCLIRKTPVEDSFFKSWKEQQALLDSQTDKIPLARQVFYTTILYFLATGERLFETYVVRTNNIDSYCNHVSVGYFDGDGLHVDHWDDIARDSGISVASARKFMDQSQKFSEAVSVP